MTTGLASRLEDIPGVASVTIDLDGFGRGIDVRLEPGADETVVMERLRSLLAAYGVRQDRQPTMSVGKGRPKPAGGLIDVSIAPVQSGARIEVATKAVKSFRVVPAEPLAIAQGLADAWCQVIGRIPIEIVRVEVDDVDRLTVVGFDGHEELVGSADSYLGWVEALTSSIGAVLGVSAVPDLDLAAS
jgi:hypothetical protein